MRFMNRVRQSLGRPIPQTYQVRTVGLSAHPAHLPIQSFRRLNRLPRAANRHSDAGMRQCSFHFRQGGVPCFNRPSEDRAIFYRRVAAGGRFGWPSISRHGCAAVRRGPPRRALSLPCDEIHRVWQSSGIRPPATFLDFSAVEDAFHRLKSKVARKSIPGQQCGDGNVMARTGEAFSEAFNRWWHRHNAKIVSVKKEQLEELAIEKNTRR